MNLKFSTNIKDNHISDEFKGQGHHGQKCKIPVFSLVSENMVQGQGHRGQGCRARSQGKAVFIQFWNILCNNFMNCVRKVSHIIFVPLLQVLYSQWKNSEGQLSWLTQALKNPDVFCLADYPCHSVVIDLLKTPPDDDNRDIATW